MTMKSYPYSDLYLPPTLLHAASRVDHWGAAYPKGSGHFGSSGGTVVCPMFDVQNERELPAVYISVDNEVTPTTTRFWQLGDGRWYGLTENCSFTSAEMATVAKGEKSLAIVGMSGYRLDAVLAPANRAGQISAVQAHRDSYKRYSF